MFTALYPSFVLVKHDLLTAELNRRLAEIAIEDAARHRVVDDTDPRNLGTSASPFGHIRHNLLAEHRGDVAVEAWLSVARAGVAEYLHRGFGAELPESLTAIAEPFVQDDGTGETIGIFAHTHPRADLVVTYYPEVDFGDAGPQRYREGALRFYDPAGRGHRLWPNRNPATFTGSWLDVRPRTGTLVVFEGHVPHDSAPFAGKRRVCLPLQVSLRFPNAQHPVEIGGSSHGLPTFYVRLLETDGLADAAQGMRLFVSGSAPLLSETHDRWRAVTGHAILERYGMTETNMNTSNPYDGDRRAGTVGFPLPGVEVKVTDPKTGQALPTGEVGVLEVRGPNVFSGYWRMPEKTAEELRENGFFITGDLAQIDADGYVSIVGRSKDLIITGGYNVYPKELELLIDDLPEVLESAVIGVPHKDFGEAVVAVVVPKPGSAPTEQCILTAIAPALARFKQPKRVVFQDALPRNTMGKVQKKELRDAYQALLF